MVNRRITAALMAAHLCFSAHASVTATGSISDLTRKRCYAGEYDHWFTVSPGDNLADSVKEINRRLESPSSSPRHIEEPTTATGQADATALLSGSKVLIILEASNIPYEMNSKLSVMGASLGICSPESEAAQGLNNKKPATINLSSSIEGGGTGFSLFYVSRSGKLFIHGVFINALENVQYSPIVQQLSDSTVTIDGVDIVMTPPNDNAKHSSIFNMAWRGLAPELYVKNSRLYNGVNGGSIVDARPLEFKLRQQRSTLQLSNSLLYVRKGSGYFDTSRTEQVLKNNNRRDSLDFGTYSASLEQLRREPLSLFPGEVVVPATPTPDLTSDDPLTTEYLYLYDKSSIARTAPEFAQRNTSTSGGASSSYYYSLFLVPFFLMVWPLLHLIE